MKPLLFEVLWLCFFAGIHARNGDAESVRRRSAPLSQRSENAQQMIRSSSASLRHTQRRRLQGAAAAKNKNPPPPPPPPPPVATPAPTQAPTKAPVPPTPPVSLVTRDLGSFYLVLKARSEGAVVSIESNKLELVSERTFTDYITVNANNAVRAAFISSTFVATDKTSASIRLRRVQETAFSEVRYELTGTAVFLQNGAPSEDEAKKLLMEAFSDEKTYAASLIADGAYSGDVDLNLEYPNDGKNETIGGGGNVGGTVGGVIAAAAVVSLAAFGFVKYRKRKSLDDAPYHMHKITVKDGDDSFEIISPESKPKQKVSNDYLLTPQFSALSSAQERNKAAVKNQDNDDDFSFDGSAALGNDVTAGDKMLGQVLAMSSFDPANTSHLSDAFFSPISVDTSAYTLGNEYMVDTSMTSGNNGMDWTMQTPATIREKDDVVEVMIESHINEPYSASGTSKINFFGSSRVVAAEKSLQNGPTFVHVPKTTFPIQMARTAEDAAHYDSDDNSYSSYGSSVDNDNVFQGNDNTLQSKEKTTSAALRTQVVPPSSTQEVDEYSLRPKSYDTERTKSRIPVSSVRASAPHIDRSMVLQNAIKAQGVSTTNFAASARRTRLEQEKARVVGTKQKAGPSQMKQETLSSQVANLRKVRLQQMKSAR